MYSAIEDNPRERLRKPVYWFIFLAFLCSLVNWQGLPEFWQENSERIKKESFFTAEEIDQAWRTYDRILARAKGIGVEYSPKNFFQDRNILVPMKYKFQKAISFEGQSSYPTRNVLSLSKMMEGLVACLYKQAEDNFPRSSPNLSQEEGLKNLGVWHQAEIENPNPLEDGLIKISGWALLRFCKWIVICYVKLIPFTLILILFQLWRKRQPIIQEIILRPRFFFLKVLEGPVGVAIYAGVEPAIEWRYAKLSARQMRQTRKWHLSSEEEQILWLQAQEPLKTFEQALEEWKNTPSLIVKKSKIALAASYLLVIMAAPVLAVSGINFQQKPVEEVSVQIAHEHEQYKEKEQEKPNQFSLFVGAILPKTVRLQVRFEPVVRASIVILLNRLAEKGWFLPPSLAPPLSRR